MLHQFRVPKNSFLALLLNYTEQKKEMPHYIVMDLCQHCQQKHGIAIFKWQLVIVIGIENFIVDLCG